MLIPGCTSVLCGGPREAAHSCAGTQSSCQTLRANPRPHTQERQPRLTLVKPCLLSSASLSLLCDRLLITLSSSWRLTVAPTVLIQACK